MTLSGLWDSEWVSHWGNHWQTPFNLPLTGTPVDPDANAYIVAVKAAGATLTAADETAIDTLFKGAKADGWYDKVVDMWFLVYGLAAPNAIGIKLTTGTFGGAGWTYGANYVQGNGSTDFFNTTIVPYDAGLTSSSCGLAFSSHEDAAYSGIDMGRNDTTVPNKLRISSSSDDSEMFFSHGEDFSRAYTGARTGVFFGNRTATVVEIYRGTDPIISATGVPLAPEPPDDSRPVYGAAMLHGSNPYAESSRKYNMFAVTKGMTRPQAVAYTGSTETLLKVLGVPL